MIDFTKAVLENSRLAVCVIVEICIVNGKPMRSYYDYFMTRGKETAAFAIHCVSVRASVRKEKQTNITHVEIP